MGWIEQKADILHRASLSLSASVRQKREFLCKWEPRVVGSDGIQGREFGLVHTAIEAKIVVAK